MSRQIDSNRDLKERVRDFWEESACGEVYATSVSLQRGLDAQAETRYALEPYIKDFARFGEAAGRDVLEIGVGMGADHAEWAKNGPRSLTGIDLTSRAVSLTRMRLRFDGLRSRLLVADAEGLPFVDASFDVVYSWGVLHHTPDTAKAVREVLRTLRPGGVARVMIYHTYSLVGYMLWLRYGLLRGRGRQNLGEIYADHLESPGTRAFSVDEACQLFSGFSQVVARTKLSFGDLLQGAVGQRHGGLLLTAAKALWPRWLIRRACARHGLMLLVEAIK